MQLKSVNIYDTVFILHSKCTMILLLTFALLLSGKQYFGEPINCMADLKFKNFVHSYCWTFGTFIIPTVVADNRSSIEVGVSPNAVEHLSLRYYQWVVIVILMEAFFFYFPSFLWKIWEGRRMEHLCSPVVKAIIPQDENRDYCRILAAYFKSNNTIIHKNYVIKYFSCELLNFSISIANILFLDYFLNGFWSRYFHTLSILSLNNWEIWNYHSSQIFPKLAKCTIYTFGLGGSINNNDALCMLPLNILNEKIFAFLWFWFILITILAAVKIIYDLFLIFCSPLRVQLLRTRVNYISYRQMCLILKGRSFGDWFLLYKMSLNVNSLFFHDLLLELEDTNLYKKRFTSVL
ncbi:innexin inx5-like [Calliphora vicina]|uniref:innexin inx5-like n=1 Tax=Calliphora vicina TaxID=7373 RepID=UPI00325AB835